MKNVEILAKKLGVTERLLTLAMQEIVQESKRSVSYYSDLKSNIDLCLVDLDWSSEDGSWLTVTDFLRSIGVDNDLSTSDLKYTGSALRKFGAKFKRSSGKNYFFIPKK